MTKYESDIKIIFSSEEVVFRLLSDLSNLEKFKNEPNAPQQLQEAEFDKDSCRFKVEGLGVVGVRIVERESNSTIKFEAENIPMVKVKAWIHLEQIAENETQMSLKMEADIPLMMKMMLDKKIKTGINQVADVIAKAVNNR